MAATLEITDSVAAQVAGLEQIERDKQSGADADEQMARLVRREKLRTARAYLERLKQTIASWPTEEERLAAIAAKQEEGRISNRMIATAQARRSRAPRMVYKTKWNASEEDKATARALRAKAEQILNPPPPPPDPKVVERCRAVKARAAEILAGHRAENERERMVFKTRENALVSAPAAAAEPAPTTPSEPDLTSAVASVFPSEQVRALGEMLGQFAELLGDECRIIERRIRDDFRRDLERVENRLLKSENDRLRKALSRDDQPDQITDFNFNEARTLTQN
jgi:hypothetical protein